MIREVPLEEGETYHLYNRGAHKELLFRDEKDYSRFLLLLYIANNSERIHLGNLLRGHVGGSPMQILNEVETDKTLVSIYAYSLMPNHFHLILSQNSKDGISLFLKKVATAYAMYFNTKYQHSGVIFQGRFKSRHISNNDYYRYVFSYVHLNPLDLVEPNWKERGVRNIKASRSFMNGYKYSSFVDYSLGDRLERKILNWNQAPAFLKETNDFEDLLSYLIQDGPESMLGEKM